MKNTKNYFERYKSMMPMGITNYDKREVQNLEYKPIEQSFLNLYDNS